MPLYGEQDRGVFSVWIQLDTHTDLHGGAAERQAVESHFRGAVPPTAFTTKTDMLYWSRRNQTQGATVAFVNVKVGYAELYP